MRSSFDRTVLGGVPRDKLVLWLAQAQDAYAALAMGVSVVSASYEGKSISYSTKDLPRLEAFIEMLQEQISGHRYRRALRPSW
jgi:hypothetical protein